MIYSLRVKLTAAFLLIILIVFSMIGIFVNVLLKQQFEEYVIAKIEQKNSEIVKAIETHYVEWGSKWDVSGLEYLGINALGDGLILRVSGKDDLVIWDAMTHNRGMCVTILEKMAENMRNHDAGFNGGYTEQSYPITLGNTVIGTVNIGYYGPFYYTDNDIKFLNTLNKLLILATVIAGIISIILGTYLAKRLSNPIARVIKSAGLISGGKYDDRITELSDTKEMVELTEAINILAESLERQEKLRKRLTADVAHELRTPLANLQSHLEAMIDGVWEPDNERLASCHEETSRLAKIVSDLGLLAYYEGEKVTLHKESFDIAELLQKIAKSFEKEFKNKKIELLMETTEQYIEADKDKIAQIIVNLLSNALKYTLEGGTVRVSAIEADSEIEIIIKDNGIGIAQENLPYIFERFYRADKSRSRATGGSGIGLAIVKSLVEAHRGTIAVISEPGIGSEFIIKLPKKMRDNI